MIRAALLSVQKRTFSQMKIIKIHKNQSITLLVSHLILYRGILILKFGVDGVGLSVGVEYNISLWVR